MPRYYFHTRRGKQFRRDPAGFEYPSIESAIEDAKAAARELVAFKVIAGDPIDEQCFVIASEDGWVLETVDLRSVVKLH